MASPSLNSCILSVSFRLAEKRENFGTSGLTAKEFASKKKDKSKDQIRPSKQFERPFNRDVKMQSTVQVVFVSYSSSCVSQSGSVSLVVIIKASRQGCKLMGQTYKIPIYQFSISCSWVRLVFIPSGTQSHIGSSEVNPQGPFYHSQEPTKWNKRRSFKLRRRSVSC